MKKLTIFFILIFIVSSLSISAHQQQELKFGRLYFPKAFVHAGNDFNRGVYRVKLIHKDNDHYFQIMNKKKELLFEELAVTKPYEGKRKKFRYYLKKEMLKGYEYFRIKVTTPENIYMAYFLVKKKSVKK